MSYPLIQDPAPLMQLAQTVTAIRQRFLDRQMQQEEMRRRYAYMKLAQQEQAANEAFRNRQITLQEGSAADAAKYRALDAERTARQDNLALRQIEMETKDRERQRILDAAVPRVLQDQTAVPLGVLEGTRMGRAPSFEGPSVTPEAVAANAAARQQQQGMLGREFQQAYGRARPGLQGSSVRAPQTGVSDLGVSFVPGTVSVNLPSGGGAGRFGHIEERTALGAGLMERIISRANELYRADPANIETPLTGDVGGAVVERVLGHGAGSRVADRVRNIGATEGQIEFRGLREQFKHSMAVFFPRVSIALMENLSDSYFPVGGEVGTPAQAKMAALNDVWRVLQEVRAGRATRADLARRLAAGAGDAGARFLAEALADEQEGPGTAPSSPSPTAAPRNRFFGP